MEFWESWDEYPSCSLATAHAEVTLWFVASWLKKNSRVGCYFNILTEEALVILKKLEPSIAIGKDRCVGKRYSERVKGEGEGDAVSHEVLNVRCC